MPDNEKENILKRPQDAMPQQQPLEESGSLRTRSPIQEVLTKSHDTLKNILSQSKKNGMYFSEAIGDEGLIDKFQNTLVGMLIKNLPLILKGAGLVVAATWAADQVMRLKGAIDEWRLSMNDSQKRLEEILRKQEESQKETAKHLGMTESQRRRYIEYGLERTRLGGYTGDWLVDRSRFKDFFRKPEIALRYAELYKDGLTKEERQYIVKDYRDYLLEQQKQILQRAVERKERREAGTDVQAVLAENVASTAEEMANIEFKPISRPIDIQTVPTEIDESTKTLLRNIEKYNLGVISRLKESSSAEALAGAGTISTGEGDIGGVSYGAYQFKSKEKGVVSDTSPVWQFIRSMGYGKSFRGLTPGTKYFNEVWMALAKSPDFAKAQHEFTKKKYYDPTVAAIRKKFPELPISSSRALQELIWSTAVQFGAGEDGGAVRVFSYALSEYPYESMSIEQVIGAITQEKKRIDPETGKAAWFIRSPKKTGLQQLPRFEEEQEMLLTTLEQGQTNEENIVNIPKTVKKTKEPVVVAIDNASAKTIAKETAKEQKKNTPVIKQSTVVTPGDRD